MIGEVHSAARRLVRTTYEAMWKGIRAVRPGATLGDIGHAIETHAKRAGYSVVRDYCGHGIGREMHEDPQVLHFGKPGKGLTLREGMTFTIEPMLNSGPRGRRDRRRRLDRHHHRREAVGPVRAHGRGHKGRRARADAPGR